MKLCMKVAPFIIDEVFELWCATSRHAVENEGRASHELLALVFPWRVVGIPKKDENESRPIAVASCLLRAWLSCMAKALPEVALNQWACRKRTSVVHAISEWLAEAADSGLEMDLSKAYDNIDHGIAAAAFEAEGVPKAVIATCQLAWQGPRFCCVANEIARPVWPTKALPQGDSCAPGAMTGTLVPWNPSPATGRAFMDDRSLTAKGEGHQARLEAGLQATQRFDSEVGFVENAGKRQEWSVENGNRVEHLGVTCVPSDPSAPILPRGEWVKLMTSIQVLASLPGAMSVRERLAAAYIRPHWIWACPLIAPVPKHVPALLFRAVLNTRCMWWCQGRWWAQRIELHPLYGAAIHAMKAIESENLVWSPFMHTAVSRHCDCLGLQLVAFEQQRGLCLQVAQDDDERVLRVSAEVRGQEEVFWTADPAAKHAIRAIARIRCLQSVRTSRHDSEGVHEVDIEASSHRSWKAWVRSLSYDEEKLLRIFRSGATRTPTRRHREETFCPFCQALWPSLRHFWQDCPRFQERREFIQADHGLAANFWAEQPRVTSKSGWITHGASRLIGGRVGMQIAACQLGISILELKIGLTDGRPEEED